MNCNGDNNDAAVYWGTPLPLDSGQVYAVIDTLATETGNATYVGLSINDAAIFDSPANVLDTGLKGSADSYAPTVNDTGKFFVHYYARNCAPLKDLPGARPQDCTQLTDQMVTPRTDTSAVGHPALKGLFMVALRDYIVPGTERGADPSSSYPQGSSRSPSHNRPSRARSTQHAPPAQPRTDQARSPDQAESGSRSKQRRRQSGQDNVEKDRAFKLVARETAGSRMPSSSDAPLWPDE